MKKYSRDIEAVIGILKTYGAKKIILFGSASKGNLRKESDLDFACEGIKPEEFFKVHGKLLASSHRRIDLIDLKDAKKTLRKKVEQEGIVLYDAH